MAHSDHPISQAACERCGASPTPGRYCAECGLDRTPDEPLLGIAEALAARMRDEAWRAARDEIAGEGVAAPIDPPAPGAEGIGDFAAYHAASGQMRDLFGEHHRARLARGEQRRRMLAKADADAADLSSLHSAAVAATRAMGYIGCPDAVSASRIDAARIKAAIGRVDASFATHIGFFERMKRQSSASKAAGYLNAVLPLFENELDEIDNRAAASIQQLDREQRADDERLERAYAAYSESLSAYLAKLGAPALPFDDPAWRDTTSADVVEPRVVRLVDGYDWAEGERRMLPVLAKVPGENVYVGSQWFPDGQKDFVNGTLLRALRALPPGQLKLLLIDPTSLGDVFSPLLGISEYSDEVLHTKVWTSESDIRARLEETSDRVGLIIQKYLTDEYETLEQYNRAAGEVTEPSVLIAINDFPRGLDDRSIEIVRSLAEVGPRAGISLILLESEGLVGTQQAVAEAAAKDAGVRLAHWKVSNWFERWGVPTADSVAKRVKWPGWLGVFEVGEQSIAQRVQEMDYVQASSRASHTERPSWDPSVADAVLAAIGERFDAGSRVEVELGRVLELYEQSRDGAAAGPGSPLAPDRWWRGDSTHALEAPIGRHGSRSVSTLRFDSELSSSALLVGRPGSGKSNLLHVVIHTLAALYPPEELELYLLDFKEAVEFAPYGTGALPHVKAVALESDREFGLAVLRHLAQEIERRGALFKASTGTGSSLVGHRTETGERLARIVLVVDEFHRLFDREDSIATEAAKHLDDLVRLGRGFGIHCLLASQTLLGMTALGRHTLNQVGVRLALQCSDEDSRVLLADDNGAAALLTRPGEGVKNTGGGRTASNEPFQVPLLSEQARRELLDAAHAKAARAGLTARPRLYRRNVQPPWEPPGAEAGGERPSLRLGEAVALDPQFGYPLSPESGCNLLIVGRNEALAGSMLAAALADLRLRHPEAEMSLIDLTPADGPLDTVARALDVEVRRRRAFEPLVHELARLVEGREPSRAAADPTHLVVINGLAKLRELDPEDFADDAQELLAALQLVLRDGPEVGVHTVAWCDTVVSVDRRLGRRLEREFGARVAFTVSAEDSLRLCDSEVAADLGDHEAVLVDIDRGTTTKFQPYACPDPSALAAHAPAHG